MNRLKIMLQDKNFLIKTLVITVPIALQNLLSNVLNLVDTLMIGRLGETPVAAVGLANKVFFVFTLLMFGINSGSGVLASQYWGKRELLNIRRVLRMSLFIAVGGSLLFLIPGILCPKLVMSIFTPEKNTIAIGALYLGIIAFSYPITAVTNSYVAILRSMNYVMLPVINTTAAIVINIFLNYSFIFGKFGFPAMGASGSALATLIARIIECVSLLIIVYMHKAEAGVVGALIHTRVNKEDKKNHLFLPKAFVKKYIITTAPVITNEFFWGLGVTMYSMVYGRMGNASIAAITITQSVEQVAMVFFFGMSAAAAVILGNALGANELKKAEEYAKNYIVLQVGLTMIGAVLTFLAKDFIISWFAVSDLVAHYIRYCLTVFAIYMPFRMLTTLYIVAIFRSGGDTKAALFLDVSGVWLIGIPMAVLGGLVLKKPIYVVYAMVFLEEIYKCILGTIRYKQKKWIKNIIS